MLRALAVHGVEPDLILGTSVGAINDAAYAVVPGPEAAERLAAMWADLGATDLFSGHVVNQLGTLARTRTNLFDNGNLRAMLTEHVPVARIEDLDGA